MNSQNFTFPIPIPKKINNHNINTTYSPTIIKCPIEKIKIIYNNTQKKKSQNFYPLKQIIGFTL